MFNIYMHEPLNQTKMPPLEIYFKENAKPRALQYTYQLGSKISDEKVGVFNYVQYLYVISNFITGIARERHELQKLC